MYVFALSNAKYNSVLANSTTENNNNNSTGSNMTKVQDVKAKPNVSNMEPVSAPPKQMPSR